MKTFTTLIFCAALLLIVTSCSKKEDSVTYDISNTEVTETVVQESEPAISESSDLSVTEITETIEEDVPVLDTENTTDKTPEPVMVINKDNVLTQDPREALHKSFTIAAIFKLNNVLSNIPSGKPIIFGGSAMSGSNKGSSGRGVALSFYKNSKGLYFDTYNGSIRNPLRSKRSNWNTGKWYYVTLVNNDVNNTKQLYINGTLENSTETFSDEIMWGTETFTVDFDKHPGLDIYSVSIYDHAFSSNEVENIFLALSQE